MSESMILLAALYFLPNLIAYGRGHCNGHAILALNILLGWTMLGWIIAMIWSLTGNIKPKEKAKIW